MQPIFIRKKSLCILICVAALAGVCWIFALAQMAAALLAGTSVRAIPAFQQSLSHEGTNTVSGRKPRQICMDLQYAEDLGGEAVASQVLQYLQGIDGGVRLVASHQEKNYLDLYFYSPALEKNSCPVTKSGFNLQVAVTDGHAYFGTPFLTYDF